MGLSNVLKVFSVEALDTRLEPPADEKKRQQVQKRAGPPRWTTPEFLAYGVIFAIAVPLMFKAAMDSSSDKNANYSQYEDLLEPGWINGRLVDNSDDQYSGFRDNMPYLGAALAGHFVLRRMADSFGVQRLTFDVVFGALFLLAIHGVSYFKILLILSVNFAISRIKDRKKAYLLTWVYNIAILFANELLDGYQLHNIHPSLLFIDKDFSGIMSRWEVTFKFTILRMISFNIDYIKARENGISKRPEKGAMTERERIDTYHALDRYNFTTYVAYALYSPLYMAGPIMTFNDFVYQTERPLPSVQGKRTLLYAARFLFCLLTMELLLHYTYVVAISKRRAWDGDSPFQISMIALFNLNIIWLKLLIIWRFFRLWALTDKIDAPENMIRCVCNNYSALSFWRSWHRSYNRWILRYIYIPLGGSSRPIVNSLLVFTFVAIWHDIKLYLLFWGWLVVIFILPEIAATAIFKPMRNAPWFRHLCAVGAVANIWMMMIANLIGFCVHLDGMQQMLHDMFATADGLKYVIVSTSCLFVGAQAMFEFREREKRKGIDMRC